VGYVQHLDNAHGWRFSLDGERWQGGYETRYLAADGLLRRWWKAKLAPVEQEAEEAPW
jgi:hypothetical protein